MDWTRDLDKNRKNVRKHSIDFPTALLIFNDLNYATRDDHYQYEQRWQPIGTVAGRPIFVIHTGRKERMKQVGCRVFRLTQ